MNNVRVHPEWSKAQAQARPLTFVEALSAAGADLELWRDRVARGYEPVVGESKQIFWRRLLWLWLAVWTVGCGAIGQTPTGPELLSQPVQTVPAPRPAGPHFALELASVNAVTLEGEAWQGEVSIRPAAMVNPDLPVRVVVQCPGRTQILPFSAGAALVSCVLPVGVHTVTATAELPDGARYPTAITVTVGYRQPIVLVLSAQASTAGSNLTRVAFSTAQVDGSARYVWDFGDDSGDRTLGPTVDHIYAQSSRDRQVRVQVLASDGRTLASGSVVGRW